MVASREEFEDRWEREYAASLGCEFCDPSLMAQQRASLREYLGLVDEPELEEQNIEDEPDVTQEEEPAPVA